MAASAWPYIMTELFLVGLKRKLEQSSDHLERPLRWNNGLSWAFLFLPFQHPTIYNPKNVIGPGVNLLSVRRVDSLLVQ